MNFRLPLLLIACIALALSGCSVRKSSATAITGTIIYSTPVDFSGGAQLQLLLLDVSAEGASPQVADTTTDIGHLPYQYSLPYDASKINAAHRYTISARIYVNKSLQYATDSSNEVLTQGRGNHADFAVVRAGGNEIAAASTVTAPEIFSGELHNKDGVTLYRAGLTDGHVNWLEEDRSNGTPTPAHNRYEFKGALLIHYVDGSPMEIMFDDTGKPRSVTRAGKSVAVADAMKDINAARNRGAMLRSLALAQRESQLHRKETKNDLGG
ncbi:MAG TPA: YbaY family lipoprotein [Steroidobacteraceae bacterium]|nr:YbaY family lipoprotein [Steroidobacteraceae bacterium]